jgi:hypothetical protein
MTFVEVFEIDRLLIWKRVEDALEEIPLRFPLNPVFEDTWLDFLELESCERMKRKPMPIFSCRPQYAHEQTLCGSC